MRVAEILLQCCLCLFVLSICPDVVLGQTKTDIKPSSRFLKWDRNKDGRLTRDELPAGLRRNFDRVDRDKDGFISPQEDAAIGGGNRGQQRRLAGIKVIRDQAYVDDDNPRHRLDLFLPEKRTDQALPVIVFIHGGGWRGGNKSSGGQHVAPFVSSGKYAAASIGYRLTGEAQWPAQIHDCKAAIRWIRANAKTHGLDAKRIAVWGTSAGGHLVAMLGVASNVPELEGKLGAHRNASSRVTCVVDFFGPTDLLRMNDFESRIDHDAANSPESLLVGGPIQEHPKKTNAASPISYVTTGDAPTLLVHGDSDPLVPFDQSVRFSRALRSKDVEATLIKIENGGHGGFNSRELNKRVSRFFQKHLLGEKNLEISSAPISQAKRQSKPDRGK